MATQQNSLTAAQDALDVLHDLLTTAKQDLATATAEYEQSFGSHRSALQDACAAHTAAVDIALTQQREAHDMAVAETAAAVRDSVAEAAAEAEEGVGKAKERVAEAVAAGAEAVKGAVEGATAASALVAEVHEMQLQHAERVAQELRERLTQLQLELAQVGSRRSVFREKIWGFGFGFRIE